jgi:hypothetical protein
MMSKMDLLYKPADEPCHGRKAKHCRPMQPVVSGNGPEKKTEEAMYQVQVQESDKKTGQITIAKSCGHHHKSMGSATRCLNRKGWSGATIYHSDGSLLLPGERAHQQRVAVKTSKQSQGYFPPEWRELGAF